MYFSELDIRDFVRGVCATESGKKFIYFILENFGTFDKTVNYSLSDTQNLCNIIKKEQGEFILNLIREHDFKSFTELQLKRSNEKWQNNLTTQQN